MATGTADSTPLPPPVQASAPATFERFIEAQLDKTRSQVKLVDFFSSLLVLSAGILGFLLVTAFIDAWIFDLGMLGRTLALVVLVGGTGWFTITRVLPLILKNINPAYAARVIEQSQPSLKNSLINFLLLRNNRSGVHEVVYQAVEAQAASDLSHVPVDTAVDRSRLIKLGYLLAGVLLVCALYKVLSPKDPFQTVARVLAPWAGVTRPARVEIEDVRPGTAQVFHGQTAQVSARIVGARSGDSVLLVYSTLDGQVSQKTIPLKPSDDGLLYEGTLSPGAGGIQQDLHYRVAVYDRQYSETELTSAYPVAETERFKLSVLPAPTITVHAVQYIYPAYTKRPEPPPSKQADLEALEGTKVTISASANLPIKSAYIEFDPISRDEASKTGADRDAGAKKSEVLAMHVEGQEARGTFLLELAPDRATPKYKSYQLRFITTEGHQNEQPTVHRIAVTRDLPPEVEILTPKEDRIEVPEDGKQIIEIRALDPDFSLSKISLRAVAGGSDLLDKSLLTDGVAGRGQAVVNYEFKPAELGLAAGDEVVYWAVAADNRTSARTGTPEPNTERTRNYHIKITEPTAKPDPGKKPGEGEKEPKPGETPEKKPDGGEKQNPDKEKPGEGAKDDGEKKPGDKGEEGKPGEKEGEGSKGGDKTGQGNAGGGKSGDKPGEKSGEKPGDGAGNKPGEKPGEQPGEKSGENPGDKAGNPGGGEKKPGDKSGSGEKGNQKPGDDPTKNPTAANDDKNAGGQKAADSGSKAGAGEKGSGQPGEKPSGKGQDTAEPGSQEAGGDPSENGGTGQNNRQTGGPGGKESQGGKQGEGSQVEKREGPLHDGEVIEKINEHLKEQQAGKPSGEPKPSQTGSKPDAKDPSASGAQPGEKQPGEKQPGGKQPGGQQPGENPAGAEQSGEKQPGAGQSGEKKPGEKQPGEKQPGEKEPSGAAGKQEQPGEKKPAGSKPGESGSPQGGTETKPEGGASGEKSQQQPAGGEGKNGKSGAGQKSEDKSGSPASQEENKDQNKKPGENGGGDKQGEEAKSPSQSKKQSNSQGGEGGDKSGGGKQGGGQGANQAGNDSAGGSTPGDTGNGAAQDPGSGKTSGQGGKGPASEKPTGVSGSEQGDGTNTQKGPGGKEPGPGDQGGKTPGSKPGEQPGSAGTKPGDSNATPGDAPGKSGANAAGGGGQVSGASSGAPPAGELPPEEKANLEYARKATDLALEHLRDQKENPDAKLLEKLGMTKDELARFVDKWESLRRSARTDVKAKRELDESLRSLGLRQSKTSARGSSGRNDETKGLLDQGSRSEPPPSYLEQFNAFKRGTSRAEK